MYNKNLFSDWITDRDHDTYVSRFDNSNSRINWEKDIDRNKGFSSFLYNFKEDEESISLLEKTYRIARTRLDSMGLFNIKIQLSKKLNATDGESIAISTGILDNKELKINEKMDVILGEVVHEGAHCLYSDFNLTAKQIDKFKLENTKRDVFEYILNVIEDEQIERNIGEFFPGYVNYLAQTKKHVLGKINEVSETEDKSILMEVLNVFFYMIRYPAIVNKDYIKKHEILIRKLREIFDGKYPSDEAESISKTIQVYNLLSDYINKKEKEEEKKKEKDSKKESKSGSGGKSKKDSKEKKSKSNPEGEKSKNDSKKKSGEDSDDSESEEKNDSEIKLDDHYSETNIEKSMDFDKIEYEDKKTIEKINKILNSSIDTSKEKKIDETVNISVNKILEIQGDLSKGIEKETYFIETLSNGSPEEYLKIRNNYKSIITSVSKKLNFDNYSKKSKMYGLNNGNLDTNKLAEAVQGVQTVYTRVKKKKIKKNIIGLLIDESGSMSMTVDRVKKTRFQIVKEMAIVLNEAISKTKSELFIYGHTADSYSEDRSKIFDHPLRGEEPTFLMVYREPGKKFNKNKLTNITAIHNNRDGVAILNTVIRIRKFTQKELILFVLSDGQPAARRYSGTSHTREMVKKVQTDYNTTVIGIGVQAEYNMSSIYDYYINFTNLENFPVELNKLIRKILKNGTRSI